MLLQPQEPSLVTSVNRALPQCGERSSHSSFASADEARALAQIIEARRQRTTVFSANLFADPAWDVMLELSLAELEGRSVATSQLAHRASIPLTTLLRWIDKLEGDGWLRRMPDPTDDRRVFVEISTRGLDTMRDWLREWLDQSSNQTLG
jgi:DNA-binding MarR family transcriptional regulator